MTTANHFLRREEFKSHGLGDCVMAACRDVCADGFGLEDAADAVFLDLPHPWDAVPHAKRALRKSVDTRICSFSPCVEQVQKACEALRKHGFNEISTVECLQRVFQVSGNFRRIFPPILANVMYLCLWCRCGRSPCPCTTRRG